MKKVLTFAALLLISTTASAQLQFGVKVGANFSYLSPLQIEHVSGNADWISYKHTYEDRMHTGFHVGGYAHYAFGERWGLQGEVLVSLYNGLYLDVPLLLSVKPFEALPLSLMVGGQLSLTPTVHINGYDSNKAGSPIDFFPALVAGIQYHLGEHLNLGLRYHHGLVNEQDYNYTAPNAYTIDEFYHSEKGGKNRVVQLSVGWTF